MTIVAIVVGMALAVAFFSAGFVVGALYATWMNDKGHAK